KESRRVSIPHLVLSHNAAKADLLHQQCNFSFVLHIGVCIRMLSGVGLQLGCLQGSVGWTSQFLILVEVEPQLDLLSMAARLREVEPQLDLLSVAARLRGSLVKESKRVPIPRLVLSHTAAEAGLLHQQCNFSFVLHLGVSRIMTTLRRMGPMRRLRSDLSATSAI
ncbi:hypothetical protein Taro_027249, partial [Colocasia esculenta]|nr:hypothetical protein [Colocasia esculenta]